MQSSLQRPGGAWEWKYKKLVHIWEDWRLMVKAFLIKRQGFSWDWRALHICISFSKMQKKGKCKFKSKKNVGVIGVSLQTVANPPFFGIFLLQNNAVVCGRVVVVVEPDLGKVQMLAREVVSLLPAADSSSSSSWGLIGNPHNLTLTLLLKRTLEKSQINLQKMYSFYKSLQHGQCN